MFVEDAPQVGAHGLVDGDAGVEVQDADRGGIGVGDATVGGADQDALVDHFHQFAVADAALALPLQRVSRGLQRGARFGELPAEVGDVHAAAEAWVTLLPLARPRRIANQRPVWTSRSRSMPVRRPMPCSM